MENFYRTTLIPKNGLGIDSIQGFLEMANWYNDCRTILVCNKKDKDKHGTVFFILNQLEKDGIVNIEWSYNSFPNDKDMKDMLELKQISLTVQGYKLLDELQNKSKFGSLKIRIKNLIWIVLTTIITAIITTLVVLKFKGLK